MEGQKGIENKAEMGGQTPPTKPKLPTMADDITERPKPVKKAADGLVEIEAIKAHDGLEAGYTKRVREDAPSTKYMIDNGFWKVK